MAEVAAWLTVIFTGVSALALARRNLRSPSLHVDGWTATPQHADTVAISCQIVDPRGVPTRLVRVKSRVRWGEHDGPLELPTVYPDCFVSQHAPYTHSFDLTTPYGNDRPSGEIRVTLYFKGGLLGQRTVKTGPFSAELVVEGALSSSAKATIARVADVHNTRNLVERLVGETDDE